MSQILNQCFVVLLITINVVSSYFQYVIQDDQLAPDCLKVLQTWETTQSQANQSV